MTARRSSHAARRNMIWTGAAVAGVLTGIVAPGNILTRMLAGWDAGIFLFMLLAGAMMARTDLAALKRKAEEFDGGRVAILCMIIAAVIACIAAIVFELAGGALSGPSSGWMAAFTIATILLAWAFVHFMFTLHYAHEYYAPDDGEPAKGLQFPGDEEPLYGDFLYFSFVIGCAAQTADVAISSRSLRRVASAHCIVAFLFNSAIIALLINISASLLSSK